MEFWAFFLYYEYTWKENQPDSSVYAKKSNSMQKFQRIISKTLKVIFIIGDQMWDQSQYVPMSVTEQMLAKSILSHFLFYYIPRIVSYSTNSCVKMSVQEDKSAQTHLSKVGFDSTKRKLNG